MGGVVAAGGVGVVVVVVIVTMTAGVTAAVAVVYGPSVVSVESSGWIVVLGLGGVAVVAVATRLRGDRVGSGLVVVVGVVA